MLQYWLWLSEKACVSKVRRLALLRQLGSIDAIYFANEADLSLVPEITQEELEGLLDKNLTKANEILNQCYELDIRVLTWQDAQYPPALRNITDPPIVLYYKGRLPAFGTAPALALIGARKASAAGLLAAKRMGYQLGKAGAIVVSGLADGIDAMGMLGALTADAPVVGVLGCGADVVYPARNRSLYEDTISRGCILTEYPPHTPPIGYHFPVRNRILSGLCDGVVVVEAAAKSGALITARLALDQGRDVFAMPGSAGSEACAGSNGLLREGAIFAETGADVAAEYLARYPALRDCAEQGQRLGLSPDDLRQNARIPDEKPELKVASAVSRPKKAVDKGGESDYIELKALMRTLPPNQCAVLEALSDGPKTVDDVIDLAQVPAPQTMSALTMLEIRGMVQKAGANRYALAGNIKT